MNVEAHTTTDKLSGLTGPPPSGFEALPSSLLARWRAYQQDPLAVAGLFIVLLVAIGALLAPWVSPASPVLGAGADRLLGPMQHGHLLGTDGLGRDILSRLIWGGRVSLTIGFVPVAIAFVLSLTLGLIAGYYQGWVGQLVMRLLDLVLAFPLILLGIAMVSVLGSGLLNVMLAMVVVELPYMTRVVYTETSITRSKTYVLAAKASGSRTRDILFREILPNVMSTLIVYSATNVGAFIVIGAGFNFLGIGVQPPTPDWGVMVSDGRLVLDSAPHVAAFPGLLIVLVALAFNWIGDGLRDALDPKFSNT